MMRDRRHGADVKEMSLYGLAVMSKGTRLLRALTWERLLLAALSNVHAESVLFKNPPIFFFFFSLCIFFFVEWAPQGWGGA